MKARELVAQDVTDLLRRAESGEALSEIERRRVLSFLLFSRGELWPSALFAEFFKCTQDEIESDISDIRSQAIYEARNLDLQAELMLMMRQHVAALDRYISENADRLRPQDFAALIKERRELIQSTIAELARLKGW